MSKNLMVCWTPRHHELHNTTTYQDHLDKQGNNNSDTLANMRDNLPMDLPPPRHSAPRIHNAHPRQTMDIAASTTKSNVTHTLGQLDPIKALPTNCMAPMAVGTSTLVGLGRTLGNIPTLCSSYGQ